MKTTAQKLESIKKWVNHIISTGEKYTTRLEDAMIEFGPENIFLVGTSYSGMYHDDYCTFRYYNNVTGKQFTDEWTTAFACPSYARFEDCLTISEALELGLLNKQLALEVAVEQQKQHVSNLQLEITPAMAINSHLEMNINRGRKFRGTGILMDIRKDSYQYYSPMFASKNADFGKKITNVAILMVEDTMTIEEVNYEYCVPTHFEEMKEAWRQEVMEFLDNVTLENMEGLHIVYPKHLGWENFVERYANELPDGSMFTYPAQQQRDEKENAFKAKKIADLTEWAKNNTDVPENEIPQFVERLFNKKYGRR